MVDKLYRYLRIDRYTLILGIVDAVEHLLAGATRSESHRMEEERAACGRVIDGHLDPSAIAPVVADDPVLVLDCGVERHVEEHGAAALGGLVRAVHPLLLLLGVVREDIFRVGVVLGRGAIHAIHTVHAVHIHGDVERELRRVMHRYRHSWRGEGRRRANAITI